MGGAVNVVVREKNGRLHKMCRWTNNLTSWLYTTEIASNPDALIKEYIKARANSPYDDENTSFSPGGYGLVVIDCLNKEILSHQNYTAFDQDTGASYNLDFRTYDTLDFKLVNSEIPFIDLQQFKTQLDNINRVMLRATGTEYSSEEDSLKYLKTKYEFFMSGAVTGDFKFLESYKKGLKPNEIEKAKRYEKFCERFNNHNPRTVEDWKFFLKEISDRNTLSILKVKLGDFKITDFRYHGDSEVEQLQNFKKYLYNQGFRFTSEDEKDWLEYLSDLDC